VKAHRPTGHIRFQIDINLLWMEEVLHQLIGGKHPIIIYRLSSILLVVQEFFHPQ
jgi:hypothetical protein